MIKWIYNIGLKAYVWDQKIVTEIDLLKYKLQHKGEVRVTDYLLDKIWKEKQKEL